LLQSAAAPLASDVVFHFAMTGGGPTDEPDSGEGEEEKEESLAPSTGAGGTPPPPPPPSVPPSEIPMPPPIDLPPLDGDVPPPASVPVPRAYQAPTTQPAPEVQDIEPEHGPVYFETRVTLRGNHLYRTSIVRVGGQIATTVGAREPSELRVLVAPLEEPTAAEISVQNPGRDPAVLTQRFRYERLAAPILESVAPTHGAPRGGTEMTLVGTNFHPKARVEIDGAEVEPVNFVDETTLDVSTPPGEHGRTVDVAVINPDGRRVVAPRAFQYDERY